MLITYTLDQVAMIQKDAGMSFEGDARGRKSSCGSISGDGMYNKGRASGDAMTDVADQYGVCMAVGDKRVNCNTYHAGGDSTGGGKSGNCKQYGASDHCCRKEERVLQEERTLK